MQGTRNKGEGDIKKLLFIIMSMILYILKLSILQWEFFTNCVFLVTNGIYSLITFFRFEILVACLCNTSSNILLTLS